MATDEPALHRRGTQVIPDAAPSGAVDLLRELHGDGLTVVFVEHIMAAVMALSQRLVVMHEGQVLVDGPPREVVEDPRVVEAYLGEEQA